MIMQSLWVIQAAGKPPAVEIDSKWYWDSWRRGEFIMMELH